MWMNAIVVLRAGVRNYATLCGGARGVDWYVMAVMRGASAVVKVAMGVLMRGVKRRVVVSVRLHGARWGKVRSQRCC